MNPGAMPSHTVANTPCKGISRTLAAVLPPKNWAITQGTEGGQRLASKHRLLPVVAFVIRHRPFDEVLGGYTAAAMTAVAHDRGPSHHALSQHIVHEPGR